MPYIIETSRPDDSPRATTEHHHEAGEPCTACGEAWPIVSRRAVATLEEARRYINAPLSSFDVSDPAVEALAEQALTMGEDGGTVALPDGTTYRVTKIPLPVLRDAARDKRGNRLDNKVEIIDAYNAAQEG